MLNSIPVKVVLKDIENVPEMPDLASQIEFTVSTGGRCGCRRVAKADKATGFAEEPRRIRIPATVWMPPSRRKPPWCVGFLRHSVSVANS
jgi:hypothetical protein